MQGRKPKSKKETKKIRFKEQLISKNKIYSPKEYFALLEEEEEGGGLFDFGGGDDEGGEEEEEEGGDEGGDEEGGDEEGGEEEEEGGDEEEEEDDEPKPYLDNPEYRISLVLQEATEKMKDWFKKGQFGKEGYEVESISRDRLMTGAENGFTFQFSRDKESFFSMYFMISMDWAMEEVIKNAYVEIKCYDYDKAKLKKRFMENIEIKDFNEDWLLEKVKDIDSKMKKTRDKSKDNEYSYDKELDLKDNIY